MTHNAFTYRATAWLLATLMMFFGDVAMASSLKLADPSELAGRWQATLNTPQDTAESQALQDKPANGWFPEPDGISITGKEGSRIVFFSRQRDGLYKSTLKSGLIITLVRAAQSEK